MKRVIADYEIIQKIEKTIQKLISNGLFDYFATNDLIYFKEGKKEWIWVPYESKNETSTDQFLMLAAGKEGLNSIHRILVGVMNPMFIHENTTRILISNRVKTIQYLDKKGRNHSSKHSFMIHEKGYMPRSRLSLEEAQKIYCYLDKLLSVVEGIKCGIIHYEKDEDKILSFYISQQGRKWRYCLMEHNSFLRLDHFSKPNLEYIDSVKNLKRAEYELHIALNYWIFPYEVPKDVSFDRAKIPFFLGFFEDDEAISIGLIEEKIPMEILVLDKLFDLFEEIGIPKSITINDDKLFEKIYPTLFELGIETDYLDNSEKIDQAVLEEFEKTTLAKRDDLGLEISTELDDYETDNDFEIEEINEEIDELNEKERAKKKYLA